MRAFPLALLAALAGCNPGITPPQNGQVEGASQRNAGTPAPPIPANETTATPPSNSAVEGTEPGTPPSPAGMSPYRRREYERGYRDCMTGRFDRERQGESYRIGCMAAEDVRQRH